MKVDRLGRAIALELAAARFAVGAGATFASRQSLRLLGFDESDGSAIALARVLGARDLALATLMVAARDDRDALRTVTLVAAAIDVGDALTFGLAARDPKLRRGAIASTISAGIATAAGAYAAHRLTN